MDLFTQDLGLHQGRIPAPPGEQGYVYELGHSLLARAELAIGDRHQVSQQFVIAPGMRVLRARVRLRVPAELPQAPTVWAVSVSLNGERMVSRELRPAKRPLVLEDLVINLTGANAAPAPNTIAFRLELTGPWPSDALTDENDDLLLDEDDELLLSG